VGLINTTGKLPEAAWQNTKINPPPYQPYQHFQEDRDGYQRPYVAYEPVSKRQTKDYFSFFSQHEFFSARKTYEEKQLFELPHRKKIIAFQQYQVFLPTENVRVLKYSDRSVFESRVSF